MKKLIVWPEKCAGDFEEVLRAQEPGFLHSVVYITVAIFIVVFMVVAFGKADDVVRANGIVRTEQNVSCVKAYTSGQIVSVAYRNGDFVQKGQTLIELDKTKAQADVVQLKIRKVDCSEKLEGVCKMIMAFENSWDSLDCKSMSCVSRYESFVASRELLDAKVARTKKLYETEKILPPTATTIFDIEQTEYDYEMSVLEKNDFESNFISGLRQEKENLYLEYQEIIQNLLQAESNLKTLIISSPVDGYVQEVSLLNPGDVVFSDQQIVNIIPVDSGCRIELNVSADRMGKLEKGQKVLMRFPAFPFNEFKGTEGVITMIQSDSRISDDGGVFFTVFADLNSTILQNKKKVEYKLKNGLEVNARIVLERQTLLYFLLKKLDLER